MTEAATSHFVSRFLEETAEIAARVDRAEVNRMIDVLAAIRAQGGRLFILGVGGSAGNASHAVNDFRKLAEIEAYAPTDNVSELTARINDEGWDSSYAEWLKVSRLGDHDALLVLSVGGGDPERGVSRNLVAAVDYGRSVGARVCGIVGRDGGHTARVADACVIIPTGDPDHVTAQSEAFQGVIWHLMVTDPRLSRSKTRWESLDVRRRGPS